MIFIAKVFEEGKPSNGFLSEVEANDFTLAIQRATFDLIEAFNTSTTKQPATVTVILTPRDFAIPPQAWRLDCTTKVYSPIEVPCGECLGYGGVDSGGFDPQGAPITVECPSCHFALDEALPPFNREAVFKAVDASNARFEAHALLTNFQNDTWASLDKYSKALGWGLSGMQPECWTMLDSAVNELVKARKIIAQSRAILGVPAAHSDDNLPSAIKLLYEMYAASQGPR